jgi:hypothetical protein
MDRIIATASESEQRHDKKFVHFYCVKARDYFKTNIYEEVTFRNGKKALKAINPSNSVVSYLIIKQN